CTFADGKRKGENDFEKPRFAEIYLCASDKDQANIVYKDSAKMAEVHKTLNRHKICQVRRGFKEVRNTRTGSVLKVLSKIAHTKHGYSPSHIFFDEVHAYPNFDLVDTLTEGTDLAEEQQLIVFMSTAGFRNESPEAYKLYQYALAVHRGEVEDETLLPAIYAMEEGDDWQDPEVWGKCNPGMGKAILLPNFERWAENARKDPEAKRSFCRLGLNQWQKGSTSDKAPIPDAVWAKCRGPSRDWMERRFRGQVAYGGLDLCTISGLTAFVLLIKPEEEEGEFILPYFWLPEENAAAKGDEDEADYAGWGASGDIDLTPGNIIHREAIRAKVLWAQGHFRLKAGFNVRHEDQFVRELRAKQVDLVEVSQSYKTLTDPCSKVREAAFSEGISHPGNAAMSFCIGNMRLKESPEGEKIPNARASLGPICGARALVWAKAVEIYDPIKKFPYDERGAIYAR
ncbi:MAG: terminase TerL endonuclease subunit, partial [Acidobacteriota bacterium]